VVDAKSGFEKMHSGRIVWSCLGKSNPRPTYRFSRLVQWLARTWKLQKMSKTTAEININMRMLGFCASGSMVWKCKCL